MPRTAWLGRGNWPDAEALARQAAERGNTRQRPTGPTDAQKAILGVFMMKCVWCEQNVAVSRHRVENGAPG
jgi:hypothetical protein